MTGVAINNRYAKRTSLISIDAINIFTIEPAMSMLDAKDNEHRSYLEIADALRQYGAKPEEDCAQLWRRMVFNILYFKHRRSFAQSWIYLRSEWTAPLAHL